MKNEKKELHRFSFSMVPFESYHYVISLSINDYLFLKSVLMRTEKKERGSEWVRDGPQCNENDGQSFD